MASVPSTGSPRSHGKHTPSPAGTDAGHKGLSGVKLDVSLYVNIKWTILIITQ